MFGPHISKRDLICHIKAMSDEDFARYRYVEEMAGAFLAIAHFEDTLIDAMNMCDRVKVRHALGDDADRWEAFKAKRATLQDSTLGSLISILDRQSVSAGDVKYLKWLKAKRDHFVHRWFHDGGWPGDLDEADCRVLIRRLLALQLWLSRGEHMLWRIFERADFIELTLFEDGALIMNKGVFDLFDPEYVEDEPDKV